MTAPETAPKEPCPAAETAQPAPLPARRVAETCREPKERLPYEKGGITAEREKRGSAEDLYAMVGDPRYGKDMQYTRKVESLFAQAFDATPMR